MHELPWILVLSLTLGVESAEKLHILGNSYICLIAKAGYIRKSPEMRIHKQMIWYSKCLKSHPDLLHFPTYDSDLRGLAED